MTFSTHRAIDLYRTAKALPSMGGREIGAALMMMAGHVPEGQAIVEVGSWLGSGTAHLAMGARHSGAPVHAYDRWKASEQEVAKAAASGIAFEPGQDTLPWVKEKLAPFRVPIHFHQGGLKEAAWDGRPIGLYVDDASKSPELWRRATKVFLPHVPIGGILVLMDYFFFEQKGNRYRAQYRWMATRGDRFRMLEHHVGGTTAAIFERIR